MSRNQPQILVVGDVMLDQYTWGTVERISPEAPVLVLRAESEDVRLGGAAGVAALLSALEIRVLIAGVVGDDAPGRLVQRLLAEEASVSCNLCLIDPNRPTTVKERLLGRATHRHPHQLARVDRESCVPLDPELEARFLSRCLDELPGSSTVLISDYGKSICSPRLTAELIQAARKHGIPVLVDPARGVDYERYRSATLIKPNRPQAEAAIGRRIVTCDDAVAAGAELCRRWEFDAAVITLDQDGMALALADGTGECFVTHDREICDVTGAGDTVLAVLGMAIAERQSLGAACRLANNAAGLQVARLGVVPLTRAELQVTGDRRPPDITSGHGPGLNPQTVRKAKLTSLDALMSLVRNMRRRGRRIVLANGCFDLLHAGHVSCLEQAAEQGDVLIVALNSDASVRRQKGPGRPIMSHVERTAMLSALSVVDYVVTFDEDTPEALIQALCPDVLVKGHECRESDIPGRQFIVSRGGRLVLADHLEGPSTTKIIEQIISAGRLAAQVAGRQPPVLSATAKAEG